MKIVIKATNIKLNQALKDFVEEKINELEMFGGKPVAGAWVEIGKSTKHHKKGPFFRAECQMHFPGKSLRAEAESEDLRFAITQVKDELQRQISQHREKVMAKIKRGARALKKDLRLSPAARFFRKGRIREEGI